MGHVLTIDPVKAWLDHVSYLDVLTIMEGDGLHTYLLENNLPLPEVIQKPTKVEPGIQQTITTTLEIKLTQTSMDNQPPAATVVDSVADADVQFITDSVSEPEDKLIQSDQEKTVVVEEVIPEDNNKVAVGLTPSSFEEILQALTTNGNFIDGSDGEVIRVRKGALYGFISQGKATILLPEVVGVGDTEGDVVVNSIELSTEVRDGKTTIVPHLGKQYFVSTGTPQPEVLNEDCIRLHNQVIGWMGWEGVNSPIPSRAINRKEIQTAGFLVSLTDA